MTAPSVLHIFPAQPELDRTQSAEPFLRTNRIVEINKRAYSFLNKVYRDPVVLYGRLSEPAVKTFGFEHPVE